jgi:hypothetical protein
MSEYQEYATKAISPTMVAFAEWIALETGVEVDLRSIALGDALRSKFQKSEWWKSDSRNYLANVEANRAAKATEAADRAKASLAKAQARVKAAEDKAKAAVAAAKAKEAEAAKNVDKAA